MSIKPIKEVAKAAYDTLYKYQMGELTPIKTGREWLDSVFGGLLPTDIVTITGSSGGGKSFELQRIKNFVMNIENNPNAGNFVWLDHSLEMKYISNIIRDLNSILKKSKKRIISEIFTEEEKKLVRDYYKTTSDSRFFINEDAMTATEFEMQMIAFLEQHKDKEAVFISIDHIALEKDEKNGDKKGTVDGIVEAINRLKKLYPNTYWVILSQLNRNILARIREKDVNAMPNRGDVFQSDTIFHISDYLYACHNPHRLGIKQFSRVNAEVYDYLQEYLVEEKNGKASFDTLGKIFFIVLKIREADIFYRDIYIEEVEFEGKEKYRDLPEEDYSVTEETPKFTPKPVDLTANYSITDESDNKFKPITDIWSENEKQSEDDDSPF